MKNRIIVIVAVLAVLIGGYLVYKSMTRDDDTAIRELFARMEAEAEKRDWGEFMKHFSKDYSDKSGNSFLMILGMVKSTFDTVSEIDVKIEDLEVSVFGEEASASCKVHVIARQGEKILYPFGREGEPEKPRITLKKERGDWKITRVEGVREE